MVADQHKVARTEAGVRRRVGAALILVAISILVGGLLFEASSLAFDYMKLRGLPLYSSAASLPAFAEEVATVDEDMREKREEIRQVFRDRGTIDIDIASQNEVAASTLSEARTLFRPIIPVNLNFTDLDNAFQLYCNSNDNAAAAAEVIQANIDTASTRANSSTAASKPAASPAGPLSQNKLDKFTPEVRASIGAACHIDTGDRCDAISPPATRGLRLQMICAQKDLQSLIRRKAALGTYSFDDRKYITDSVGVRFPDLPSDKVDEMIRVWQNYQSTACPRQIWYRCYPAPHEITSTTGEISSNTKSKSIVTFDRLLPGAWNWLLSFPLALIYLMLGFIFGLLGSLTKYLYEFADPGRSNPQADLGEPILAGAGAAVVVLIIVMAGFQFLAVGASSSDLAYPNPLTACALSVMSGLAGRRVLELLQRFVKGTLGGAGNTSGKGMKQ